MAVGRRPLTRETAAPPQLEDRHNILAMVYVRAVIGATIATGSRESGA